MQLQQLIERSAFVRSRRNGSSTVDQDGHAEPKISAGAAELVENWPRPSASIEWSVWNAAMGWMVDTSEILVDGLSTCSLIRLSTSCLLSTVYHRLSTGPGRTSSRLGLAFLILSCKKTGADRHRSSLPYQAASVQGLEWALEHPLRSLR